MTVDWSLIILWASVVILLLVTWRKKGWAGIREALSASGSLTKMVLQVIPFALLAAIIFTQMLPQTIIANLIGPDTGVTGMVIAAIAGGMLPSGPYLSFPIAMTLYHTGAGDAQLVAFLTGWSTYAFYRILVWELPMVGLQLTAQRLAASIFLPIIAGVLAGQLFKLF